jgi:1-deoxy-D-xylulose 5-phosphate reductoisomerase
MLTLHMQPIHHHTTVVIPVQSEDHAIRTLQGYGKENVASAVLVSTRGGVSKTVLTTTNFVNKGVL